MRMRRNTAYYGKIVAQKLNLDLRVVHKVLIRCNKRIVKIMMEGNDLHIDDCLDIMVHKEARVKYFKLLRENATKNHPNK